MSRHYPAAPPQYQGDSSFSEHTASMNSVQNPNFEPIFQQLSPRDQTQSQIENPSNPSQPLSSHAPTIVYNMPPVPQPNRYYGGNL